MGKRHSETEVLSRNQGMRYRAEFNATNQVVYEGWSIYPNALTSEAKWQIAYNTYDASGNLTQTDWADGTDSFEKVWDNRALYSY